MNDSSTPLAMLQRSPMVPSLNLAYATLTRPSRTLIELPRPPPPHPETSTNIAKFDPHFFSKKKGGQNPSKEDVSGLFRGARKFYEISQVVYKMTLEFFNFKFLERD